MIAIAKRKKAKRPNARAPIDETMKYLFGVSKGTLLNMLGGLFGREFASDATVTQTNTEFVTEAFDIIRGDLFHVVADSSGSHHLHIELQTRPDGHIAIPAYSAGGEILGAER